MSASREHDDETPRASRLKRFGSREKVDAVLRLLKGDSVATVSAELGVAVHRLERWQNDFVTGGSAALSKQKGSGSDGWLSTHATRIVQWVVFLMVLAVVTGLLELFLQRPGLL